MPAMFTRRSAALCLLLLLALPACVDVGTVNHRRVSTPLEDGKRTYEVETRDPDRTHQRTVPPDHRWVRQCYDVAIEGESTPYYCATDRTVAGTWIGGLTAAASLAVTWLLTAPLGRRVPPPAPIEPAGAGAWLFERADVERRAHDPARMELQRMAVSRYGLRAGVIAVALALAAALIAGRVGPYWVTEWAGAAGAMHIALYTTLYAWWIIRSSLLDEVHQTRLAIGIGVGVGLFAASYILAPNG